MPHILLFLFAFLIATPLFAVDVNEFGAAGDGRTDDTAAIQLAADAGGDIAFSTGTYRLTRTVTIDLDRVGFTSLHADGTAKIVMAGAGPAFKFVGTHEGTASPDTMKPNIWQRQRMPLVDGLAIEGEHPEADGIEATGTVQLTVTRVHIRKARHGIHLTQRNRNVIISNCHIYENSGIGIYYDHVDLHQSNIIGCHISYNRGGGIVSRGGNVRNVHIGTCDIEGNMGADSPPTANVLIDARGSPNGIAEVAIVGCTIQHSYQGPGGANIRVIGNSEGKAAPGNQEGHVTIADNVLSDVQTNIHLQKVRGVTVTGNTLWKAFARNLLVEGSRDVVISSNNLNRNSRYASHGRSLNKNAILIRDSQDIVFNANLLSNTRDSPAGLAVENCKRVNITNNAIVDCDGPEILLENTTHSRVSDCLLNESRLDQPAQANIQTIGGAKLQIVDNLTD